MKMIITFIKKLVILMSFLLGIASVLIAQNNNDSNNDKVSGIVTDLNGNPIGNVLVKSYVLRDKTWSGNDGSFSISVAQNDNLHFSKSGYQELVLTREEVTLNSTLILTSSVGLLDNTHIPVNFNIEPFYNTTGAVFRVSGDQLRKNPTNDLIQALSGLIPGFFANQSSIAPGRNSYNNHLRGSAPVILLNGVPREIVVDLNEIEEVVVYRDYSASAMYGDIGANGIINIITRKGKPNTKIFEADYQVGFQTPLTLPEFPDAYHNATLYNQARQNDGLEALFESEALESFQNGSNPLRYPNIDYYGEYLRAKTPTHNLSTTFMGGDNTIQYYLHGGYQSERGLENFGERIKYDRILIRSDLGVEISDMIRMDMGITGWMDLNRYPRMGQNGMFGILATYPAYSTPMMMGDSIYLVSRDYPENLHSKLTSEGFLQSIRRTLNFNFGLTFDLSKILSGLTMKHYLSLDLYNELLKGKGGNPAMYEPIFTTNAAGEDSLILNTFRLRRDDLEIGHTGDDVIRHYTYYSNFNYQKEFGNNHFLNTDVLYFQNSMERRGKTGDIKSQMLNAKLNYSLSKKYIVDLYLSYMGTQKLANSNRFRVFPGFGAAWVASSESFLQNTSFLNLLKFRVSYGETGYVNIPEYYVYRDTWYSNANVSFGTKNINSNYPAYKLTQTGNSSANWPVIMRSNIGFDAAILNNAMGLTLDLFKQRFSGQLARLNAFYTGMEGDNQFIPYENYNSTVRKGIDAGISYSKRSGVFNFTIGGNFAWSVEHYDRISEINYPDTYRNREGERTDAIWGLESAGLFRDQEDISSSPAHMFGKVFPGDIKYIDQNNDNIIDEKDEVIIGHNSPAMNSGIFLNIGYGNLALYLQGEGIFDSHVILNNSFYWPDKFDKYSAFIMQNEYPRLSTYGSINNYQISDYWITSGNRFRLKTIELSYQLPALLSSNWNSGFKVYVRGNNLITLTDMKYLDPENKNAGLTMYPLYKTLTFGISIEL